MSVRVFVRAAKLDFTEDDAWGKTRSDEFMARNPAHLTPMLEATDLPKGVVWESCAIMQYLCNKHDLRSFLSDQTPALRAMVDSAMFYIVGTLYPYVARATYPALGFPQYAGEVGASDADAAAKARRKRRRSTALAEPLEVFHKFYHGRQTVHRRRRSPRSPTSGSPRRSNSSPSSTIRCRPGRSDSWRAIEATLGAAYSEPAGDVRGYIAYVKGKKG